jgi:hypothetical protein
MIFDKNGKMLNEFARPQTNKFVFYEYCNRGKVFTGFLYRTIIESKILIIENF